MAGGKVDLHPELQVVDEPEQPKLQASLETELTDIYPACVVSRYAARKARDNEEMKKTVLPQSNEISPQEQSLDTVVADLPRGCDCSRNSSELTTIKRSIDD